MAIRVKHAPNLSTIANAAYVGGLGEFRQRQQRLAQQQQQFDRQQGFREMLAGQDAIQRQINNDMRSRQMAFDQARQNSILDMQQQDRRLRERQFQTAQDQYKANQEIEAEDRVYERQQDMLDNAARQAQIERQDRQTAAYERQLEYNSPEAMQLRNSGNEMTTMAREQIGEMFNMNLNPVGVSDRNDLMTEFRGIMQAKQSGKLLPAQYNEAMAGWLQSAMEKNLSAQTAEPPSPESIVQERTAPYMNPDGTVNKDNVWSIDKNGDAKLLKVNREESPVSMVTETGEPVDLAMWARSNEADYRKMFSEAYKDLMARQPVAEDGSVKPVDSKAVAEEVSRRYEMEQGLMLDEPAGVVFNPETGLFEVGTSSSSASQEEVARPKAPAGGSHHGIPEAPAAKPRSKQDKIDFLTRNIKL